MPVTYVPQFPEYATVPVVLGRLRMSDTSPDADYVAMCTDAANEHVDGWINPTVWPDDPPDPIPTPYPPGLVRSAVGVAIRIYRFRDTEANIDEGWGPEGPVSLPADPLAGYRDVLAKYRPGAAWAPA